MFETCEHTIDLLDESEKWVPSTVEVSVWDRDPSNGRQCDSTLSIQCRGGNVGIVNFSVYREFALALEQLKPNGLFPYCYGACPQVHVSCMDEEMVDCTMAYRLSDEQDGWVGLTVKILDYTPEIVPTNVERRHHDLCRRHHRGDSQTREALT